MGSSRRSAGSRPVPDRGWVVTVMLRLPDPPRPEGLVLHHQDGTDETPALTYVGAVETSKGVVHAWHANATFTPGMRITAVHIPLDIRLMFRSHLSGQVAS